MKSAGSAHKYASIYGTVAFMYVWLISHNALRSAYYARAATRDINWWWDIDNETNCYPLFIIAICWRRRFSFDPIADFYVHICTRHTRESDTNSPMRYEIFKVFVEGRIFKNSLRSSHDLSVLMNDMSKANFHRLLRIARSIVFRK